MRLIAIAAVIASLGGCKGKSCIEMQKDIQPGSVRIQWSRCSDEHDHAMCVEDGLVDGGEGALLGQRAREQGIWTPVQAFGVPRQFLAHATRDEIVDALRLRPNDLAADVLAALDAPR